MSDNVWDDDDDDTTGSTGDNGIKQMRKQFRELQRRAKELEDANVALAAKVRTNTIAEVLAAKGVNPKVARLIPTDVAEDGIEAWLEDMKDVLPLAPKTPEGDGTPAPEQTQQQQQQFDPNVVETWQRMGAVTGNGAITPSMQTGDPREKAMRELAADPSVYPEDLAAKLQAILDTRGI